MKNKKNDLEGDLLSGNGVKTLLQVLFLSLLCYACGSGEKQQQPKDYIEIDMVPLIEGEAEKVPLQEWAKSVRFIPLETNNDILMENVDKVLQRGDTLLIHHSQRLSLFDRKGKYLYDIGSKGQGPGEFTYLRSVLLHEGLIYVQEQGCRFKVYDWDGNFVKKLVLPHKVRGLITYPGREEMLAYVTKSRGEEPIRFYRLKGEQVLDSIPNPFIYPRGPGAILQTYMSEFLPSQGSLNVFSEVNSDTVYRVDENLNTHPHIVFNMGRYLYTREERYNTTRNDILKRTFNDKYTLMVVGEIGDKVFIRDSYGQALYATIFDDEYTFCYDKQTQEAHKYFLTYPENDLAILEGAAFVPRFILDDKYLVDWEQPDNDENPVLVLVEP